MLDATDLLDRLVEDRSLQEDFRTQRESILERFHLSEDERCAFLSLDVEQVEGLGTQGFRPVECRILRITW